VEALKETEMEEYPEQEELIRRYLLGATSEEESDRVERLLMTDQEQFETALILEDELVDDYVQGVLNPTERSHFDDWILLTKERRQKIWFADLLRSYTAKHSNVPTKPSARSWPFGSLSISRGLELNAGRVVVVLCTLIIGMVVLSTVMIQRSLTLKAKIEEERGRTQASLEESSNLQRELLTEREKGEALRHQVEALGMHKETNAGHWELLPGISRGEAGASTLLVLREMKFLEIDLRLLHGGHERYRVELYDENGRKVAMQDLLKAIKRNDGSFVPFKISADTLVPGNYRLQLMAVDKQLNTTILGTYYAQVQK
jgi:hypothetical protein